MPSASLPSEEGGALPVKRARPAAGAAAASDGAAEETEAAKRGKPSQAGAGAKQADSNASEPESEAPGPRPAYFDVYGAEARPGVELKADRKHPIKLPDVTNLVLWVLGEGTNPNWVFIKNKPLVSKVVLAHIPGIDMQMLRDFPDVEDDLRACCGAPMPVNALSPMVTLGTTVSTLLTVNISAAKKSASASEANIAADSCNLQPTTGAPDRAPPFPSSYYVLTPAEMVENNYPLPVEAEGGELRCPDGYIATQPPSKSVGDSDSDQYYDMLACDCEMCYTSAGLELTRATFLSASGTVVYDELVRPPRPITDYNTRHSGITAQMMEGVTTTITDVQAWILKHVSSESVLVGHGLENDLRTLKTLHSRVIDTALLFPHPKGPPFKPALRVLSDRILGRRIQDGGATGLGHDSAEDARAALDLALLKIKKGPAFGVEHNTGKSLFEVLDTFGKRSMLVDRRRHLHKYVTGSAGAIPCHSDEEAVRAACREVKNAKTDLVWLHLADLGAAHEARAQRVRAERAASVSGSAPLADAKPLPPEPPATGEVLRLICSHVKRLHAALPPNVLLLIATGQGDTAEVRRMQEEKWKRLQAVDGRPPWDEPSEAVLMEATCRARQAMCFVSVKT